MPVTVSLDVFDCVPGASPAVITPAPAVALAVSDHFNRGNEFPIAGNWASAGPNPIALVGNRVQGQNPASITPPGIAAAYWSADAFPVNQYAAVSVVDTGGGFNVGGPCVHVTPTTAALSCYAALGMIGPGGGAGTSTLTLRKYVANVATDLAVYSGLILGFTDVIRLSIVGWVLHMAINGIVVGPGIIDTDLPGGAAGLCAQNELPMLDNWAGGLEALVVPVTTTVQWFQEAALPSEQQVGTGAASALNRRAVAYVRRDEISNLLPGATIQGGPAQLQKVWRVHSVDTSDPEYFIAVVL